MIQWLRPPWDTKVTVAVGLLSSLQIALVINLLCGRQPSASTSYWIFMSDKHSLHSTGILSLKWPTCSVSVTCFLLLFAQWHRICFSLPCYIFITAELCWYSPLEGTENTRTCTGSGKHDLTRAVEREDSQRSKHCCSLEGKCLKVPEATTWPHQATRRAEGNLLKTRSSSPTLTWQLVIRHSSTEWWTCLQVFIPVRHCNRSFGLGCAVIPTSVWLHEN